MTIQNIKSGRQTGRVFKPLSILLGEVVGNETWEQGNIPYSESNILMT